MGNIQRIQERLKVLWTNEGYSEQFNGSRIQYKDFDHALKHVQKSAGRLLELTEAADHDGFMNPLHEDDVIKYLADIVISTMRMANVYPIDVVDLEKAVIERIETKMNTKIEPDSIDVQKLMPKVFVKALIAPGVHVCQIVNENKGPMELWLETAEGSRQMRVMDPGTSIFL